MSGCSHHLLLVLFPCILYIPSCTSFYLEICKYNLPSLRSNLILPSFAGWITPHKPRDTPGGPWLVTNPPVWDWIGVGSLADTFLQHNTVLLNTEYYMLNIWCTSVVLYTPVSCISHSIRRHAVCTMYSERRGGDLLINNEDPYLMNSKYSVQVCDDVNSESMREIDM